MMKNVISTLPLAHASKMRTNMAHASKAFALALLLGLTVVAPVSVQAADAKAATKAPATTSNNMGKIAVVDTQYLVSNSNAGKSIRTQLDKQRENYKKEIEKQESDLRTLEKKLIAEQSKMSKEQLATERKKFQDKVMQAQKSVQDRRIAFDKAYTTSMEKLREHIVKIVADLAGKDGISLVLPRQDLVLVDARLDMTKDVMTALNAKVSSIPVTVK
jgi:outer membrane protein